jgi:tRNA modification GTPase
MLQNALSGVGILPIDLLAADLTEAWKKLGEITGATAPEEVIDEIFDKFCVGK